MEEKRFMIPGFATAQDIKRIRKMLGLTQKEFSNLIGCSKPTVERWETSEKKITGPVVLLLKMLERQSEYVEEILVPPRKFPLRLWYMHRQNVCTLIDVDEIRHQVKIRNYTDNVLFRAFGSNESPDFEQYQEFLESRCFPKSRDKIKLVLKDLDLPFYDPLMIIEKTEGRMAEDDFWIRIER
ncbi:type II toxin-antitoxin system MqsA family antitoxin [Roseburia hominis]